MFHSIFVFGGFLRYFQINHLEIVFGSEAIRKDDEYSNQIKQIAKIEILLKL